MAVNAARGCDSALVWSKPDSAALLDLAITSWPNSVGCGERLIITYHLLPPIPTLIPACDPSSTCPRNLRNALAAAHARYLIHRALRILPTSSVFPCTTIVVLKISVTASERTTFDITHDIIPTTPLVPQPRTSPGKRFRSIPHRVTLIYLNTSYPCRFGILKALLNHIRRSFITRWPWTP